MYIREEQADIRLTVWDANGKPVKVDDGNSWFDYSGGKLVAKSNKTRAGGMGDEVELGGLPSRSDATLQIQNSPTMLGLHGFLEARSGKAKARVDVHYKDDEGNLIPGATASVVGKLLSGELPDSKGDSGAVGMYKVTLGLNERAA